MAGGGEEERSPRQKEKRKTKREKKETEIKKEGDRVRGEELHALPKFTF